MRRYSQEEEERSLKEITENNEMIIKITKTNREVANSGKGRRKEKGKRSRSKKMRKRKKKRLINR